MVEHRLPSDSPAQLHKFCERQPQRLGLSIGFLSGRKPFS